MGPDSGGGGDSGFCDSHTTTLSQFISCQNSTVTHSPLKSHIGVREGDREMYVGDAANVEGWGMAICSVAEEG